jgi:hypothetical protein
VTHQCFVLNAQKHPRETRFEKRMKDDSPVS